MASNTLGFAILAASTGAVAKLAELPNTFAGVAAAAAFAVCLGLSSFLKVDVPKPQPKAKKLSKKEKRALAAAAIPAQSQEDEAEDAAKAAKAAKKRSKEQARKKAKRAAAAEQEKQAAQEKAAEEKQAAEKKLTKEQAKKKKQKEKAKAKKAAAAAAANAAAAKEEPKKKEPEEPQGWEEVKVKKAKKKVEAEVDEDAGEEPAHVVNVYVERKFFSVIIGTGGANLRSITKATGTEIEMPKEGGINYEVIISGPEAGCQEAKAAIEQLVSKGYCSLTHAGTVDSGVAVPDSKRGMVIGSKGANIKMIQDKLNVKINFPEKGSEDDVSIVGEAQAVKDAVAAIKSLIEHGYSSITHENHIKAEMEVARDMLKNLFGPGGATIKSLQKAMNVQINIPEARSGETVVVTLLGEPEAIEECRTEIATLMRPPEPVPIASEWSQAASSEHLDVW